MTHDHPTRRALLAAAGLAAGTAAMGKALAEAPRDPRIEDLLARMTLEEKAGQLNLLSGSLAATGPYATPDLEEAIAQGAVGGVFNAYGVAYTARLQRIAVERTRLGVPLLLGFDVVHGHRTIFPIPLGQAASWDVDLIGTAERIAGREAAASGVNWVYGPMVDVTREPRWGRVAEGAGESAWLASLIAAARVRGFQGDGSLAAADAVAACPKHFAAYGATASGRDYNTADISERTLREVHLPPFRAAVAAGAPSLMAAFNTVDGLPGAAHRRLLHDVLRGEWDFEGVVTSDYGAVAELLVHGLAADTAGAARIALLAGTDIDMQSGAYPRWLPQLVRDGGVPPVALDIAVRRVLALKARLGLFDDPFGRMDAARERATLLAPAHRIAAQALAEASLVLLKNEGGVLPFGPSVKRVALVGPLADAPADMLGSWAGTGEANETITLAAALRASARLTSVTEPGGTVDQSRPEEIEAAVAAARGADAVVLALGERASMSGEAASRTRIDLPGDQTDLARAVLAIGRPTAVVLFGGRPLAVATLDRLAPAIIAAWFPGTMGGPAIARLLFGEVEPTGRLPITFPRATGQIPIHHDQAPTGRPPSDNPYSSRYLDERSTPLYPFGFGLSYTDFTFAPPTLDRDRMAAGERVQVSVGVTNNGPRRGTAMVQLYIRQRVASVSRPLALLRGFARLTLAPGETATVSLFLAEEDLVYWLEEGRWGTEPGPIEVMTGPNVEDTRSAVFTYAG
jgi:beta-glucosidase